MFIYIQIQGKIRRKTTGKRHHREKEDTEDQEKRRNDQKRRIGKVSEVVQVLSKVKQSPTSV